MKNAEELLNNFVVPIEKKRYEWGSEGNRGLL
jgi:hypothetical protein